MKTIEQLCQEIESPRFAAVLNVASELRTFERGVHAQSEIGELAERMQNPEMRTQIRERTLGLIGDAATPHEEPVEDTAVAVYLLLLSLQDETVAEQAASGLPGNQPWWWARKIADRILSGSSGAAGTRTRGDIL